MDDTWASISRPCSPSHGRTTRPVSRRSRRIALAALIGSAKPIEFASSEMKVLMPTTAPHRSTSGPPEFPGLIGASVWIIGCSARPGRMRLSPLTMPRVIVCSRPIGLPIATTSSPTRSADESPSRAARGGAENRSVRTLVLFLLVVSPLAPSGAPAADRVVAATLDNGLRVLLLEDHRSPIVSFQVWYRVGSRNEQRGATGIAHFLEHMMFKGTPKYGAKQFARLVEQNGGQDNAFTSQDVTSYYVNIASDRLDLVLDLEADRMQNLLLDPKEINSERQVVIEERRTRTEDDPSGFLGEEVSSIAFKAHPYGVPIIGWMDDIKRVTPEEIRAFYKTYYVPNNAIVVAVGAFRAADALEKIKK